VLLQFCVHPRRYNYSRPPQICHIKIAEASILFVSVWFRDMENADTGVKKKINYSLCGDLLRRILVKDGWALREVNDDVINAIFLARKGGRQIAFFFSDQPARKLTAAFCAIQRRDRGQFKLLGVLIAPTTAEMQQSRGVDGAGKFPRAFFASLEEIRRVDPVALGRRSLEGSAPAEPNSQRFAGRLTLQKLEAGRIISFKAEILTNTPVGGPQSSLYRLAFKAPALCDILPPQFIMMDTMPTHVPLGSRAVRRGNLRGAVDLAPRPLLKRPFGICRAFLPHFAPDYVKHLSLPPSLALVLHPPTADHFDMLYKVLPDGIGTPLMTRLKRGQKIDIMGPLGRPFDVRRLRSEGVEEVHVIGGGVGMAPLILLVEALRYHGFTVKAFLGVARLESLPYLHKFTTIGKPRNAYAYIDDLLAVGLNPADIYVSCESAVPSRHGGIVRGIPRENLFHGPVPEQYRRFLLSCHPDPAFAGEGPLHASPRVTKDSEVCRQTTDGPQRFRSAQNDTVRKCRSIIAFTCGPNRMMELVAESAGQAGVRLQVLLEKRMACGIGVCFSCVQKVRRPNGTEDYARTCTEGPLFDAKDILWKNDDSKQTSANSCCAAHC
jgi:NAD(P)H-flavin reductase